MAKMDKKWVVLCSSAVAAVYAAGYFTTENQANFIQQHSQHVNINLKSNSSKNNQINSHHLDNTQKTTSYSTSKYKDGFYKGTGMNRRGMIEVTVTIKNDKITDVEISQFGMHYSESDIVGLPHEVLQNQSSIVSNVSGATYSTQAFEDAVQDALSKAENI